MNDRFLDILRHGEVEGGARFRGCGDDPLTAAGANEMQSVTELDCAWDAVISSPARRCAEFAEAFSRQRGLPLMVWPELRERGFGYWEALPPSEIAAAELEAFWADSIAFTPPGGEPFADFHARALSAWERLLATGWSRLLVVTHGGVVRILVGRVLDIPVSSLVLLEVPHACLTRIRIPGPPGRPSLVFHRGSP